MIIRSMNDTAFSSARRIVNGGCTMNDYRDPSKKIDLSARAQKIVADAKARFKPRGEREATLTGPAPGGKTPFLSTFEEMPGEPYILCLAHAIVRS